MKVGLSENFTSKINNALKEAQYGVHSKSSLKEGSEVLRVWDENSKEYKTLQSFVDKLNQASSNTEYYLQNLYFDFGQRWKYTAIVAKKDGQEWQAATPKDLEDILINGNEEEVLNKLVSKNG